MQYRVRPTDLKHLRRTDSPGFGVGRSPSTCQSGHPVRRRPARYIKRRRVRSMVARKRLAAALVVALAMFVVACGSSDSEQQQRRRWGQCLDHGDGVPRSSAPRSSTPILDEPAPRARSTTAPARTRPACGRGASSSSTRKYGGQGLTAKLLEFPTSADQQRNQFVQRQQAKSDGLRHLLLRRDLDRRVRRAEVAARHDATTSTRASPSSSPRRSRRSTSTASTSASRRPADAALHLLPHDKVQRASRRRGRRSTRTPSPRAASSTRARPTRA